VEIEREYYVHDATCDQKSFYPPNARGLRTCKDCSGVFDKDGKGVAVTDKRFDEGYEQRKAEVEHDSAGGNIAQTRKDADYGG